MSRGVTSWHRSGRVGRRARTTERRHAPFDVRAPGVALPDLEQRRCERVRFERRRRREMEEYDRRRHHGEQQEDAGAHALSYRSTRGHVTLDRPARRTLQPKA